MISVIVMIFAVCNSFESIVFILSSQEILSLDFVQEYFRPLSDLLMVINSSINVFIYCAFRKEFREKFVELYFKWNCNKTSKQKPLPLRAEVPMIPMIRAQLPKTSVELTDVTKEQKQDIYKDNIMKGQELEALIGAESSEKNCTSGNIDIHNEAREDIAGNSYSDDNTKKVNEHEDSKTSNNLSSESTIETSDASTKEITSSSRDMIMETMTGLNEVESVPEPQKASPTTTPKNVLSIEQKNDLAKKIISDVLQAVAERTTEVEIKNNVCSLVEDITVEDATVEDDTVKEDATVKEDTTIEEDATVKEDAEDGDATVKEDATVEEGTTVVEDTTVKENATVEKDATVKDATATVEDNECNSSSNENYH